MPIPYSKLELILPSSVISLLIENTHSLSSDIRHKQVYMQLIGMNSWHREKESTPSLYKRFLEGDADDRVGKDYKKTSLDFKRVRTTKRVPRLKVRKLKQQDETKLQKRSLRYVLW